jgi:hypothetical protein
MKATILWLLDLAGLSLDIKTNPGLMALFICATGCCVATASAPWLSTDGDEQMPG